MKIPGGHILKKTDKKIEKNLIEALTNVCDAALENVQGFKWLTHFANYRNFPASLSVVCVFGTRAELEDARASNKIDYLIDRVKQELVAANIDVRDARQHLSFDTEEACEREHGGKWNERFRRH